MSSRLIVNSIRHTGASGDAVTLANDGTCTANITNNLSNRRLTINGAMTIAQRCDTASVTDGYGGCDRFKFVSNGAAVVTLKQDTGNTTQGFAKAQRIDVTTADSSLAAGDYALLSYRFEGQDLQQLKKGTANAQQVTLSFYIKSPKTGTHIVELVDQSNSGRHVNKSYTVSSADTWEKKTVTFPMETSNTITNDNARRMDLNWWLAAGSTYSSGTLQTSWGADTNANRAVGQVNTMDNTSNDIYITGVQLEVSDHATDFEHRSYAQELELCKRYFQVLVDSGNAESFGNATGYNSTTIHFVTPLRPEMRTVPTLDYTNGTDYYGAYQNNTVDYFNDWTVVSNSHSRAVDISAGGGVSITAGSSVLLRTTNAASKIRFSAEL